MKPNRVIALVEKDIWPWVFGLPDADDYNPVVKCKLVPLLTFSPPPVTLLTAPFWAGTWTYPPERARLAQRRAETMWWH